MTRAADLSPALTICHPERSLAVSKANRQTESKDPVAAESATGTSGNFRIEIRSSKQEAECIPVDSREAAEESSPRHKAWEEQKKRTSPGGARENTAA